MILLWIFLGLFVNGLIGAAVWASIDDEDLSLYRWYRSAPHAILKWLTLQGWPVGLFFYLRRNFA